MLGYEPILDLPYDLGKLICPGPQFPLFWSSGNISLLHWFFETLVCSLFFEMPKTSWVTNLQIIKTFWGSFSALLKKKF
jgi:hypothetical protein